MDSTITSEFSLHSSRTNLHGAVGLAALYPRRSQELFLLHDTIRPQGQSYDEEQRGYRAEYELMKGHKMQLFLLDLSMIGWALLCMLTLGLGVLLLQPYNTTAHAAFYRDLINDYDDADGNESFGAGPDFEEVQ